MNVNVSIILTADEPAPSKTAEEILIALGGDPATDTINYSVSQSSTPPPPPLAVAASDA